MSCNSAKLCKYGAHKTSSSYDDLEASMAPPITGKSSTKESGGCFSKKHMQNNPILKYSHPNNLRMDEIEDGNLHDKTHAQLTVEIKFP